MTAGAGNNGVDGGSAFSLLSYPDRIPSRLNTKIGYRYQRPPQLHPREKS